MSVQNLLLCAHTPCMSYVTNTFLLVRSSGRSKQLLCFVHGQGQKRTKTYNKELSGSTAWECSCQFRPKCQTSFSCIPSRKNDSGKRSMLRNIDVWHSKLMCSRWNWFIRTTLINLTKQWCIHSSKFCPQKKPIQNSVFSLLTPACDYRAVLTAGEK